MGWMDRLKAMLSKTSVMSTSQARKKLWELNIDDGIDTMMGGFGQRAAKKEAAKHAMQQSLIASGHTEAEAAAKANQAFPGFWNKVGRTASGKLSGVSGAAGTMGSIGRGAGGFAARRVESFMMKAPGRIGRGIEFGVAGVAEARRTAIGLGKIGQLLLTGKGPRTSFGDAFFPYFKTHAMGDVAKYSLNPVIGRRLAYAAAPIALLSGMKEALHPAAPPPSVYFDGRYMRHTNDMGAGADYGQKMLGSNSILNEDTKARLLSQLGHIF